MNEKMTKEELIKAMKNWYMPNFYDIEMFDYTKMSDDEVYKAYLEEYENFGEELNEELRKHLN